MPTATKPPLRPYQADGVAWLRAAGRAILADEMGLGKSRVAIEASQGATLVVAPAMVLSGGVWEDQITKWADDPERFVTVPYSQLSTYNEGRPGREVQDWIREVPWDTVILDEAHYIKGRKSIRTELALQIAGNSPLVFALTGTPIPNWAFELFTLLQLIYPGEASPGKKFGSYWRWVQRWFRVTPDRYSEFNIGSLIACNDGCDERPVYDPCEHYHDFVEANLAGHFLQRKRDDVLPDLPPLTERVSKTPMGPKQGAAYRRMKKEYIAQLDDREVVAWTSSARHVKLDRITTGLDLVDEDHFASLPAKHKLARVDNAKLMQLEEDLSDRSAPTIVMAWYHDSVDAAARVARSLGLQTRQIDGRTSDKLRGQYVREFQAGRVDVLVGSLETLSEGLTLTQADCLIFLEKSYKPSRNQQAERRIHRLGQERPCLVIDYVTPDSVDQGKRELLATKTDHQIRTLTAARFKQII